MHRNFLLFLLLAGGTALSSAQAQQPSTDDASASPSHNVPAAPVTGGYLMPEGQEEGVDANWTSLRPIVPAMVGGYGSSMAFGEEMERSNYVQGGVTVQSTYDDNAYLSPSPVSNYAVSVFPQISLDQSRSRVRWLLNYAGGYTFNEQLTERNQTSQDVDFDVQYRVSPHVSVRATEVVTLTTGLFGAVNSLNGSAPGIPQGSNSFVLTPLAKDFTTLTRGEIGYQFSATDIVGASGGFSSLQYRDQQPGIVLLNTQTESGAGFYTHRVTPANWVGASYTFEHLGYPDTVDNTIVHSVIAFDTYAVKPTMTLTFFGGPQYSENRFPTNAIPPQTEQQNMWSAAGGVTFSWQAPRTSASATFTRRIADGGGVQGSVLLNGVSGSFRRQLTTRWALFLTGGYGANDSLTPSAAGSSSTDYASGGINVTRQIAQNFFFQAGYYRQKQKTTGLSSFASDAQRNLVIASFSYQFARPWGQ